MTLGDEIVVQIKAKNVIGWGQYSTENTVRDVIKTAPLEPLTLVTDGAATDSSNIEIFWQAVENTQAGLDTILSYHIYWDDGSGGQVWALLFEDEDPF